MSQKTVFTCDVVVNQDEYNKAALGGAEGNQHYQNSLCGRSVATKDGIPLGIFVGKNEYHLCHDHLQLPVIEIFRLLGLLPR